MDRWHWGQASLPFLRGGVSRSSLSNTRPLTTNEKDPSAPLGMTIREEHFSSAHFIRYSGYPSPTLSFRAQREIFLALCSFLLLSQNVSPFPRFLASFADGFPFSAFTHTTLSPPARKIPRLRSGWRYRNSAFQTYPLYAAWNKPIPPYRHFERARNLPCTPLFLAPFTEGFPFPAVAHMALYQCAGKIEGFARDDDTGIALSKHIRCTLREINLFPHTVISSAARNLPCTLLFLAPFAKGFPFSAVSHRTLYRCARKIEGFARDDVAWIPFPHTSHLLSL